VIGKALLKWMGGEAGSVQTDALERAAAVLDTVPPERARYVAAFAYLLARVAGVDSHVTADEMDLMHRLVQKEAELSDDEAKAVVDLALGDALRFGGTHNLDVTREFMTLATFEQRLGLMRCLFAVSAADDSVASAEDSEIRRISRELKIEHADFILARADVRDHLAVLRKTLPG
jgi:uncharacterized tellurite resistance protein B-like protein